MGHLEDCLRPVGKKFKCLKAENMRIALVANTIELGTPAQQLVDRFIIGLYDAGRFKPSVWKDVHAWSAEPSVELLERRRRDFGLKLGDFDEVAQGAHALVVVGDHRGVPANEALIERALKAMPRGGRCFVYGALANSLDRANRFHEMALKKEVSLLAGTAIPLTWRLPEMDLPVGVRLLKALIVVQGESRLAELEGLEGLLPRLERRKNGETGVRRVRYLSGETLWAAGERGDWPLDLLAAALSRSDRPQGDALKDARTQDLLRLGLVPKLAENPFGWILEHVDGLQSVLLGLDGVVGDINFAVRTERQEILSAQLYRPPGPAQEEFSRLAAVLEQFFQTGERPWLLERNRLTAGLLEVFSSGRTARPRVTPQLDLRDW